MKIKRFLGLAAAAFLAVYGLLMLPRMIKPAKALAEEEIDFASYVSETEAEYTSDAIPFHDAWINLNGLYARLTGRTSYNNTRLLKNGMLSWYLWPVDTTALAASTGQLYDFCAQEGIDFLYVQLPYKMDLNNELLPDSMTDYGNQNINELLEHLEETGVPYMDQRQRFAKTPEDIEQYFYRTDHHWNYQAAFGTFQDIVYRLNELNPDYMAPEDRISLENWETHELHRWFLGTHGKRVGAWYGGVDDMVYYTPRFDNDCSMTIPKHELTYEGSFEEAFLREEYTRETDWFKSNPYMMYVGGDYPLVLERNALAPCDKKILILEDSYSLPVQAFLSTVYTQIDVIDPRYFEESIAAYIQETKPDVVLLMMNPTAFPEPQYRDWKFPQ